MRLLIAEDDPKLLKTLAHIFESNNYSVDKVNNGKDAIDYAMTGEYDGLILDIMMPGADGLAVLRETRILQGRRILPTQARGWGMDVSQTVEAVGINKAVNAA